MDKYNIYKNCSFVFGSCDAYSFLWDNFFKLLFKYFPSSKKFKFYGMVENDYLYDGVVVKGYHASLKNNSFSSRLIEALKNVDTEFIIFFLDDFYLEGKVNEEYIFSSFNLLFEDKNIGHIVLHDFQKEMDVGKKDYNDSFVIMNKRTSFRISAQCSFWRKDYLLKILRKYEDAWEFEFNGTYRSRYYKEINLYHKDNKFSCIPYMDGGILGKGKIREEAKTMLKRENINIVVPQIEKKPHKKSNFIKKIFNACYVRLSVIFKNIYHKSYVE